MEIKVGDIVRITERYAEIGPLDRVGIEFDVEAVVHRPTVNKKGEVFTTFVTGDPEGWGVWVNFLEVVKSADECPQCYRADGSHKLGCGERFGSKPQGEPSEEDVEAALRAYWGSAEAAEEYGSKSGMRAALRAAWGTR